MSDITPSSPESQTINVTEFTIVIEFYPTAQIPEIKVIDFLTGLFKVFNLTAFKQDDGTIKIETLDNFYASGTSFTIDEYVDMTQKQVNVALPYREISFKFKGLSTKLALQHEQLSGTNRDWGNYRI